MKKRVVRLYNKLTHKETFYTSVKTLFYENKEEVGVQLGSVWNALSKNKGVYENRNVLITYIQIK